uniref:Uncharacterized protein LOC114324599 n=1 Tax=Diabrotica virgifera virgifera TaxID=50390 RepID=A0A6P7EYE9_DIAVI
MEYILKRLKFTAKEAMTATNLKLFFVFCVWVIVYLPITIFATIGINNKPSWKLFTWIVNDIYEVTLFVFTFLVTIFVEVRIKYITKLIKKFAKSKIISTEDFEATTKFIRFLKESVDQFNTVFGYPIFIFLTASLLQLIKYVFFLIYGHAEHTTQIMYGVQNLIQQGMTILIITRCDSVEKIGKKMYKTCYKLHEKMKSYDMKQQFFVLGEYAENLAPQFYTPLYGHINRQTFNVLIAVFVDALVILIQFQMSLK